MAHGTTRSTSPTSGRSSTSRLEPAGGHDSNVAEAHDGLKFDPPAEGVWLPGLWGLPLTPRTIDSIYFDTPRWALARGGITLHRQVENGVTAWHLNLCTQPPRREFELNGGGLPPAEVRALLRVHMSSGDLVPVAELRTVRSGIRVSDDGRTLANVLLTRSLPSIGDKPQRASARSRSRASTAMPPRSH